MEPSWHMDGLATFLFVCFSVCLNNRIQFAEERTRSSFWSTADSCHLSGHISSLPEGIFFQIIIFGEGFYGHIFSFQVLKKILFNKL